MSDIATRIRGYYDAAAEPVTHAEIMARFETDTKQAAAQPPTRRMRPVWAAVGAFVIVLLAIGGVPLMLGGGENPVTSTPPTSQAPPPPTTIDPALSTTSLPPVTTIPAGPISAPLYEDAPSFVGTVEYSYEPGTSIGWRATVVVRFSGPMTYEAEVLTNTVWDNASAPAESFLAPGTYLFTADGTSMWRQGPHEETPVFLGGIDIWRHLFFDSGPSDSGWSTVCGAIPATEGTETLLGRTMRHVACDGYEIWVDEASGLILKMSGPPHTFEGLGPGVEEPGGFTFTDLTFGAVPSPGFPIPEGDWQQATVTWTEGSGFEYEGPSELRDLVVPTPFLIVFERDAGPAPAFIAVVEIARGWTLEDFYEYTSAEGLTFADIERTRFPGWVTYAGIAAVDAGESTASARIPWLSSGIVHLFGFDGSGLGLGIDSAEVDGLGSIEVHIGEDRTEGSYADVTCGFAPQGSPDRTLLVTSLGAEGSESGYSYEGPESLTAGSAVFLHRITQAVGDDGSPSYAALIGFADGYAWEDFVLFAGDLNLVAGSGNLSLRDMHGLMYGQGWPSGDGWQRPDWIVFDAALETGCDGTLVTGAEVTLVPGHYVIAADIIPGIFEITRAQVVATLEVTP